MTRLKSERKYSSYRCGRCNGNILYEKRKGMPKVCPECGYGHGTLNVYSIPSELRLNLKHLNLSESGSRGKLEQTTITSR